jgi:hypothetical protein
MAVYVIQAGQAFTIATKFTAINVNVIRGEFGVDNDFFDSRTFTDTHGAKQEYKGSYQGTGSVRGFLDDASGTLPVLADFNVGTAPSIVTFTLHTNKTIETPAHIHNWRAVAERQGGLAEYSFDFRTYGPITSISTT